MDSFIESLGVAIAKDMAEIRETELDYPGGFKSVYMEFENEDFNASGEVFVDRLGRLVVQNKLPWTSMVRATVDDVAKNVVKKEPRFEGDKASSLVIYLESSKGAS